MKGIKFMSAALLYLATLSGTAFAQETAFDVPLASSVYVKDYESFKLAAANDTEVLVKKSGSTSPLSPSSTFEPPLISGSKIHQYLGLGTIALAALTVVTHPEGCEHNCSSTTTSQRQTNGTHAQLAKATSAMALAAVATGILVHWDDIHILDGISDPDNLHALLGITGAAMMAYAVNKSKNSATPVSHAGIAELGALGMVAAIKLTW